MIDLIENSTLIIDFFGYFPSFHDFEILHVSMDISGPEIHMVIYAFEMSKEVKDRKYVHEKNCRIRFKFSNILGMELKDFNNQNVLSELSFKKEKEGIKTSIKSSYGLNGTIISSRKKSIQRIDGE